MSYNTIGQNSINAIVVATVIPIVYRNITTFPDTISWFPMVNIRKELIKNCFSRKIELPPNEN
jgi:hypothetical protein